MAEILDYLTSYKQDLLNLAQILSFPISQNKINL